MLETGRAPTAAWPGGLPRPAAPWKVVNATLLAAAVAAGVTGYFVAGRKSAPQSQVTTGTVQRGSVLSTVSASGNVEPARSISLSFQGTGTLVGVRGPGAGRDREPEDGAAGRADLGGTGPRVAPEGARSGSTVLELLTVRRIPRGP
jgi:hypothetical protein